MNPERQGIKSILLKGKEPATRLAKEEDGKLILIRKIKQGIVIGGNIVVEVLDVERDRVKLGISAPGNVTVMRQELLDAEGNLIEEAPDSIKKRHER